MSKSLKNFKKNRDYYYNEDEEEYASPVKSYRDKRKEKRIDRALRTKDISALVEEDELDDFESYNSAFEEDKY